MGSIWIDGLIFSLGATLFFGLLLWWRPRLMLHDAPQDIQDALPPKTPEENRLTNIVATPFLLAVFGWVVYSTWVALKAGTAVTFWQWWFHASAVFFVFNFIDLVIIDWLILCWWTPSFMVIPGTEGLAGYKDYGFHFRGFLKGCVITVVVGLMVAVIIAVIQQIS